MVYASIVMRFTPRHKCQVPQLLILEGFIGNEKNTEVEATMDNNFLT